MNVDHRFTQTQHQYAADDLETMSEAKRYQDHVFQLLRPFIGQPVPEPGRANAIGCPDFIPGSFKTCLWVTDPRGAGIATGRN